MGGEGAGRAAPEGSSATACGILCSRALSAVTHQPQACVLCLGAVCDLFFTRQVAETSSLSWNTRIKGFIACFVAGILCSLLVRLPPPPPPAFAPALRSLVLLGHPPPFLCCFSQKCMGKRSGRRGGAGGDWRGGGRFLGGPWSRLWQRCRHLALSSRARFCSGCRGRGCTSLQCFTPLVTSLRLGGKSSVCPPPVIRWERAVPAWGVRRCLKGGWGRKEVVRVHPPRPVPSRCVYISKFTFETPLGGDRRHVVL